MQKKTQEKIDSKLFTTQGEVDKYMKTEVKKFQAKQKKEFQDATQSVANELQKNVLTQYDKSKMTKDEVQNVENNANKRAAVKLGGESKVKYLNNKVKVIHKGKVLPSN